MFLDECNETDEDDFLGRYDAYKKERDQFIELLNEPEGTNEDRFNLEKLDEEWSEIVQ
jgi:hypothetical protein